MSNGTSDSILLNQLSALRRKWVTVVLTAFVAVMLAAAYSIHKTPEYQSTATLQLTSQLPPSVLQAENQSQTSVGATVDVPTSIQVIQSLLIQRRVDKKVPGAPAVTVSQVGTTNVVQLSVRALSATTAANAANAYAQTYISFERANATAALTHAVSRLTQASLAQSKQVTALQQQLTGAKAGPQTDTLDAQLASVEQSALTTRNQLTEYQTALDLTTGGGVVIGPAKPASSPIVPKPAEYVIASLIVGLIIGSGLALVLDRLDGRLHSAADVERLLGAVPMLGRIPGMRIGRDRSTRALVTLNDPYSPAAEAYRLLRTDLEHVRSDRNAKMIQITSPQAGDGKTITTANLAITLAQSGLRVVIVDGDLRHPQIHALFGLERTVGLTSLLVDDAPLADALIDVDSVPNLRVVPAGPSIELPTDVLNSPVLRDVLRRIAMKADVVLLDSPPVTLVADAAVVAPLIDLTLLVVSIDRCTERDVTDAMAELGRVGAHIGGCVVNRVHSRDLPGYGRGYGYAPASPPTAGPAPTAPAEDEEELVSEGEPVAQDASEAGS